MKIMTTLSGALRDLFPSRRLALLFLALVVLKGSAYWIGSAWIHSDAPASTVAIYRGRDIQSFPLVRALAHFDLGEPSVVEFEGEGLLHERLAPWALHSALFRISPVGAFIVADVLITLTYFLLLAWLLRRMGLSPLLSSAGALLVVCLATSNFGILGWAPPDAPRRIAFQLWGLRLPRPFVSDVFFLIAVHGMLGIRAARKPSAAPWAVFGAGFACLLQADPFTAFAVMGAQAIVFVEKLIFGAPPRAATLKGAVAGAAIALLVAAPLLWQQYSLSPEVAVRQGVFPVDRLDPLFLDQAKYYVALAVTFAVIAALVWLLRRRLTEAEQERRATALWMLLWLVFGGVFASPLLCVLTGQSAQPYHFLEIAGRQLSLCWFVMAATVLDVAPLLVGGFAAARNWRVAVAAVAVLFSISSVWDFASKYPLNRWHARADTPLWGALGPSYRADFEQLVRELDKPLYSNAKVLGTFDHQLWSWWLTFRGGKSYLPDAMISTVPDDVREARLLEFCRLLGMSDQRFRAVIAQRGIQIFWLSHNKYQASRAHTWAPLEAYTPEQREAIAGTRTFSSWSLIIPPLEERRLFERYRATAGPSGRLDLVILNNDELTADAAPPAEEFDLVFQSGSYRVWLRRQGDG